MCTVIAVICSAQLSALYVGQSRAVPCTCKCSGVVQRVTWGCLVHDVTTAEENMRVFPNGLVYTGHNFHSTCTPRGPANLSVRRLLCGVDGSHVSACGDAILRGNGVRVA